MDTPAQLIALAQAFNADLTALAALRRTLRDSVTAAPLCDVPAFTRDLEAAYRSLWKDWCLGNDG